jgi:hypothetical protein
MGRRFGSAVNRHGVLDETVGVPVVSIDRFEDVLPLNP